jgi:hypothetical protein
VLIIAQYHVLKTSIGKLRNNLGILLHPEKNKVAGNIWIEVKIPKESQRDYVIFQNHWLLGSTKTFLFTI